MYVFLYIKQGTDSVERDGLNIRPVKSGISFVEPITLFYFLEEVIVPLGTQ
jgi:hypothetical protein